MTDIVPNLAELAQRMGEGSESAQVVAAFAADTLEEVRVNLRRIVASWEEASERAAAAETTAS